MNIAIKWAVSTVTIVVINWLVVMKFCSSFIEEGIAATILGLFFCKAVHLIAPNLRIWVLLIFGLTSIVASLILLLYSVPVDIPVHHYSGEMIIIYFFHIVKATAFALAAILFLARQKVGN